MKTSKNSGKVRQFVATIIVNLMTLSYGVGVGWTSPTIPKLRSNYPPVGDTPMNENQISWITSLLPMGGLLTIPFCCILSEQIGRKNFALLSGLPLIVSWLLIIFAQNYVHLYVARLLAGIAGAMTMFIVPLYVSEIVSEDIRGLLGSLLIFFLSIGILCSYVAGATLSYRNFACISLILPIIFLVAFASMPESPVYLMRRNLQEEAQISMMFLRGDNQDLVEQELIQLHYETKASDNISEVISMTDFFQDRATRKGLMISMGLIAGQQISGISAMVNYMETIFKLTNSTTSSEIASIIIGLIQIVGSCGSTVLVERVGRRLLILISCFGITISHMLIGLFFYLQNNNYDVSRISMLPVVALSTYMISFRLGIGPIPFIIISEVFSLEVSSFASNLCHIIYWATNFTAIKLFALVMQFFGVDGCFFMLATFCVASFVFTYCLLPETKGRVRQDIIDELAGIPLSKRQNYGPDKSDNSVENKPKSINQSNRIISFESKAKRCCYLLRKLYK